MTIADEFLVHVVQRATQGVDRAFYGTTPCVRWVPNVSQELFHRYGCRILSAAEQVFEKTAHAGLQRDHRAVLAQDPRTWMEGELKLFSEAKGIHKKCPFGNEVMEMVTS